jgi:hypothetical protein
MRNQQQREMLESLDRETRKEIGEEKVERGVLGYQSCYIACYEREK